MKTNSKDLLQSSFLSFNEEVTNPYLPVQIVVYRNVCCIIIPIQDFKIPKKQINRLTFSMIQDWIMDNYHIKVNNSSITQVKKKCGITKLDFASKAKIVPELKTEKEKAVLEAFRHYGIV